MRPRLGDRDIEFPPQLGDYGPNQRPLLFERAHVTEQQVELEPADPHPGQRPGVVGGSAVSVRNASRTSAVRADSCQPPWYGLNSIGNANLGPCGVGRADVDVGHHVGRIPVGPIDVAHIEFHRRVAAVDQCVGELVEHGGAFRGGALDQVQLLRARHRGIGQPVQHTGQRVGRRQRSDLRGRRRTRRRRRRRRCGLRRSVRPRRWNTPEARAPPQSRRCSRLR